MAGENETLARYPNSSTLTTAREYQERITNSIVLNSSRSLNLTELDSSKFLYSTVVNSGTSPYSTVLHSGTSPYPILQNSNTSLYSAQLNPITSPNSVILNSSSSFIVPYPSLILFRECPTAYWLVLIVGSFVYFMGAIGNILLFLIMLRKSMRKKTICNYFAAISVADFVHLSMQYSLIMTSAVSRSSIMLEVVMACGAVRTILVLSGSISSQLLSILCCERFIIVRFPLQSKAWLSSRTACICIAVVIVLNLIYILPNIMFLSDDVRNTYGRYIYMCIGKEAPASYIVLLSALYSYVPLFVITFMNILLIRELVKNIDRLKAVNSTSPIVEQRVQETLRALPVVIAVCLIFILCTVPTGVMYILLKLNNDFAYLDLRQEPPCSKFSVWIIISLVRLANHSVNFYLHCLTGHNFKKELHLMFGKVY